MDFSAAIPTFVITLREGVEAALVVGIVMAYLKKSGKRHLNLWVYTGIALGLVASAIVGNFFGWAVKALSGANSQYSGAIEPFLEAGFSVVAIALLSWMLVWMTRNARNLKSQVEGAIGSALDSKTAGFGVFSLVFFAILREGFETVLFIAGKFEQGLGPTLGAIGGVVVAVFLGVLMFRFGVRLDLKKFFLIMGIFLVMIIAGLAVTALGNFDAGMNAMASIDRKSAALCFFQERFVRAGDRSCVLGSMVWNLSRVLPDDRFPGILLSALFGYMQRLFLVQAIAYPLFLGGIGMLYFKSLNIGSAKPKASSNKMSGNSIASQK
ncbi:MAG: FTR1 family iron permease [Alkalinema sp. RU_4_3]|nr:FTR1 family iron permease [Alkalinema sp. RU_4_3]